METIKTLTLNWEKLKLVKSEYSNNDRLYLGLIDAQTGEPYADITENHPEISNEELNHDLYDQGERAVIDNDFINCMGWEHEAKIWLMDNIENLIGGGEVQGWPCLVLFNND